jgi:predicted PurR-regulated permease PerM
MRNTPLALIIITAVMFILFSLALESFRKTEQQISATIYNAQQEEQETFNNIIATIEQLKGE